MKEKSEQQRSLLPDAHRSLVTISPESRFGRSIGLTKKTILPVAVTLSLIASACSGEKAQTVTDNSNNEPPGLALPFEGTGFLNSGPHNFRLKRDTPTEKEVVSELDFAPKPVIKCEPGVRAIVTDWNITASESGKVTVVGDEKNELDSNHSIIQIKHPDGKSTRYTHVANFQVKKDQEVAKRQKLGNPSCEYPPSGSTDGLHLDFSVLDPSENPIDVRTITLSGWKIQGNRNYQGTMTKDGETITADGRRCPVENPCDNGKIVNSITHDSSKTPRKAVLGAAASPARPGPINAAVGEKPVVTETPKPAPSPAQESKEKEPIFPLVLLPIHISEEQTPDFKVTKKFREENPWYRSFGKKPLKPQPGWKYIYVEFAIENKGNNAKVVSLDRRSLFASKIRTKEGFEYTNPIEFGYSGIVIPDRIFSPTNTYFNQNALPPGFRIVGVYNDLLWAYPPAPEPDLKEGLINRVSFAVGEKTTDYKLSIPGFPELDLTKDAVDMRSLKLPTDRPDSDFKNPGATINIPGKGSVTFEGAVSRTPIQKPGTKVNIRFRFHNNSIGYGQNFNLTTKLFGDDGILYTTSYNTDAAMKIFPNQPLSWDGYIFGPYVPPGNTETQEVGIVISSSLKSGKLVVSGDINEIFNLNLPEITNPVKR